ncbi:MAG: hypothetical protein WAQ27_02340 [Candidatus Microsaccharimonas sp.]
MDEQQLSVITTAVNNLGVQLSAIDQKVAGLDQKLNDLSAQLQRVESHLENTIAKQ